MIVAPYLLAAATIAAGLAFLDRLATRMVRPVPGLPDRSVPDLGVPHEDLTIRSGDHDLAAWLLRPGVSHPSEPLILLAHGWGASYGTVLQLAEPLADAGHDVLLFDVRGHGRNEPVPYVTVAHFRDDVMAVARYALRRFPGRKLLLIGHSMGGSASVLAIADGARLDGLVLIAAPASILDVTADYLSEKGLPGSAVVVLLRPFWWRRIGGSFRPLTPSRRIREVGVPMLIIQPEHDTRVHRGHADRLSAAAGQPYHLMEGCGHTDVLSDPRTFGLVDDFVRAL